MLSDQMQANKSVEVRTLLHLKAKDFDRIASGYESDSFFRPRQSETENFVLFNLEKIDLAQPYKKANDPIDADTLRLYRKILKENFSFGAHVGDRLVGLLVAGKSVWNKSVWVWEFHVEENYRGQGIGKKLMDAVVEVAQKEGFRTIVCETQNKNASAIQAYRHLGFKVEGIDISYYSNQDYPNGDIAIFMKRRIETGQ